MADSNVPKPRKNGPGRPFAKGQSGNPGGLSKLRRGALQSWEQFIAEPDGDKTRRDRILEVYYRAALAGEPTILRDAVNRILGKVPDRMEVTDGRPISLAWLATDNDAPAASGADGGAQTPGPIQGGDLRPPLGEEPVGRD